jgi:hypothetical protein
VRSFENKVPPIDFPLKVHICGDEIVSLKNITPLQLSYYINGPEGANLETYDGATVDGFFKTSFDGCPMMSYKLVRNKDGEQ